MKGLRVGFLTLVVVVYASVTHAQTMPRWQVSVDALWTTVHGADDRVGDVIVSDGSGGTGTTTTLTTTPIAPELDRVPAFLVEARYRASAWGYGGRGWRVSSDGDQNATVATSVGPSGVQTSNVRLWGQTIAPFVNNAQPAPANRSPLTYNTSNELEHVRVEGYAERLWLNGAAGTIAMRFGVAYAHSDQNRHADVLNMGRSTSLVDETLATTEQTTLDLVGPLFALVGDTPLKKLHVSWLVSPSALIGTAKTDATFEQKDVVPFGVSSGVTTILRMPFSDEPRVLVPAMDLQLKVGYPITGRIEVGGAILSSSLFGMPVTPVFDNHTGGWSRQTRDVSFFSYSVFARLRL